MCSKQLLRCVLHGRLGSTSNAGGARCIMSWGGRDTTQHSHSSMLSADSAYLYEYTRHYVKPGMNDQFFNVQHEYIKALESKLDGFELVGGFQSMFGDLDQAIHLYRYKNGFENLDELMELRSTDVDVKKTQSEVGALCRRRRSVIMRSFSYWNDPQPRSDPHIYDLRQYVLKPGQMIEWGNNWVKGITYRRDHNQDVGGWFSQIGQLYCVYHLWAYKSLDARQKVRNHTWSKPGWDRTVAYTVPLIQKMESKIMKPAKYSPLQ